MTEALKPLGASVATPVAPAVQSPSAASLKAPASSAAPVNGIQPASVQAPGSEPPKERKKRGKPEAKYFFKAETFVKYWKHAIANKFTPQQLCDYITQQEGYKEPFPRVSLDNKRKTVEKAIKKQFPTFAGLPDLVRAERTGGTPGVPSVFLEGINIEALSKEILSFTPAEEPAAETK